MYSSDQGAEVGSKHTTTLELRRLRVQTQNFVGSGRCLIWLNTADAVVFEILDQLCTRDSGTSAVPSNDSSTNLGRRKRFELKKNTSRQVRGEVCLDGADVVIDGMWAGTISFRFEHNKGANGSQFYCLGCAKRSSQLVPNDSRFLADVSWGGTA